MTLQEWYDLKPGDYIRRKSPKSKLRKVEKSIKGLIWLKKHKGKGIVVYEPSNRKSFDLAVKVDIL